MRCSLGSRGVPTGEARHPRSSAPPLSTHSPQSAAGAASSSRYHEAMTTREASATASAPAATEKLYMENTLLRVAGALFCHDAKRAPTRTDKIELNKGIAEKSIVIRPDPELGQPGPLAHKIFVALIKKHSGYGRTTQPDVSFTKRELMRLIGRAEWGGSASEQLDRALTEIHQAFVRTAFKAKDKRFVEHSFNIFPEIFLERRERATDPIEACTVTLARPIIASLQDGHFTCLNHGLMEQLSTIGQALYMRLFFHFANLYDGHHKGRLSFSKRYDDICREWLGGLATREFQSVIERDQLGPHLRQLVQAQFLASYALTKASGRDGFVIAFRPGSAFFADYDRFYRHRERGTVKFDFSRDQQDIAEPLKVAYLFVEKRHGHPPQGVIPYVPSKDVQTAKELIAKLGFDEISAFLDYALAEARKNSIRRANLGRPQAVPRRLCHRPRPPGKRARSPGHSSSAAARGRRAGRVRPIPTGQGRRDLRLAQQQRASQHRGRGGGKGPRQKPERRIAGQDHAGHRTRPDHGRALPAKSSVVRKLEGSSLPTIGPSTMAFVAPKGGAFDTRSWGFPHNQVGLLTQELNQ